MFYADKKIHKQYSIEMIKLWNINYYLLKKKTKKQILASIYKAQSKPINDFMF